MKKFLIGVAVAVGTLIPAAPAFANTHPVPERGQSWGSPAVPGMIASTTPCGSEKPPFWCGVFVPHRHHWWEFGLSPFSGESAFTRTPIAGYGTGPVMPPKYFAGAGVSEGLAGPTPPWLVPVRINYFRWCPYGSLGIVC